MSSELDVYNDPDVINAQFGNAAISQAQFFAAQPGAGSAITSIAGAMGTTITITGSGSSGWTPSASGAGSTITLSLTVTNAATARSGLGLGGLSVLNAGAAVANSSVVAGAAYSQTDFQAVIDKLNAALNSLRAAGIIAT